MQGKKGKSHRGLEHNTTARNWGQDLSMGLKLEACGGKYQSPIEAMFRLKWRREIVITARLLCDIITRGVAKLRAFYKCLFLNNKKASEVYCGLIL